MQWAIHSLHHFTAHACTLAVVLLAELHGRCGYFPAHLRLRPVEGPDGSPRLPPQYEVAEILDLQAARDAARKKR